MGKQKITLRLDEEAFSRLQKLAQKDEKSVTAYAESLILDSVQNFAEMASILRALRREVRVAARESIIASTSCLILAKNGYEKDEMYSEHVLRVTETAKAKYEKEFAE
ncbi:MAG: hypothetical protein ACD_74C00082G0007 [uncultured bacterium]|nr:MAG: hypothetical protein ACD_74C00082G0007 [uncultured bacterium]